MGLGLRAVAFFLFLACLSCFNFAGTAAADVPVQRLRVAILDSPDSFDWHHATSSATSALMSNLMDGLLEYDSKLNLSAALAESWTVSPDGRVYRFTLRPNVRWSDGVILRAQDFVDSWKRLLSPQTGGPYAYLLFDLEGAEYYNKGALSDFKLVGVKAIDDRHLEVRLVRPVSYWLGLLTFWPTFPVRQDLIDRFGFSAFTPGRIQTVGGFVLESATSDGKVVLRRNPYSRNKRGNLDEVAFEVVRDLKMGYTLYQGSRFDVVLGVDQPSEEQLLEFSFLRNDLKSFNYLKTIYLGFVRTKFPVTDQRLRRALAMAVDKKKIGEIYGLGTASASSFIPPGVMGYSEKIGLPFDLKRARAELRSTQLDPSFKIRVPFIFPPNPRAMKVSELLTQSFKNLGVDLIPEPLSMGRFRTQIDLHTSPLFLSSWSADFADPDSFLAIFSSISGNNRIAFADTGIDDQLSLARNISIAKERVSIYTAVQKRLIEEEVVLIPLVYARNYAVVRPYVKGFLLNPLNGLLLNDVSIQH